MPSIEIEPFHLVDHLIRVHPEQQAATLKGGGELQSQIRPLREFLRIIVTQNREGAERASQRIANGEPFSRVARDLSSATALTGGYMGPKQLSDFDPVLADAAAKLKYGQTSAILGGSERWVILQRLPRDFMWQAEQLQKQADALALRGDLVAALERCQQALIIYPQFLRALTFMAKVLEQGGNPQRAMEVLRVTTSIYPNNARVKLNLALTLDKEGHSAEAIEACRRAIQLQPDLVPAYEYLGTALYSNEDLQGSIDVFRQGLQANPLSAELYYKLGLALARHGDAPGAKRASALAIQIDPSFISKK